MIANPPAGELNPPRSLRFRILALFVLYTLCLWMAGC